MGVRVMSNPPLYLKRVITYFNPKSDMFTNSPASRKNLSPTPFVMPNKENQKKMLALGAILSVQNQENYDTLASDIPASEIRSSLLYDSWGIDTRQQALTTIDWLKYSGHSQEFEDVRKYIVQKAGDDQQRFEALRDQLLAKTPSDEVSDEEFILNFAWVHKDDLSKKSLYAWDYMRLVNVVRWSYTVGLITEKEAWEDIAYAYNELHRYYRSWNELGTDYVLGRSFWRHDYSNPQATAAIQYLESTSTSPWRTIQW
jgi:hypothetical protein